MSIIDKIKIFDKYRFNFTESENHTGRLTQRKNGNYVLRDEKGNVVTSDFVFISSELGGKRFAKDDLGRYYYISQNEKGFETNQMAIHPTVSKTETDECYIVPETAEISQIVYRDSQKNKSQSVLLNEAQKTLSENFDYISNANANNLRFAQSGNDWTIISQDGLTQYLTFEKLSQPDEYGVRIGETQTQKGETVSKLFFPKNFTYNPTFCKEITPIGDGNYILESNDDEKRNKTIVKANGELFTHGKFSEVENMPQFRSIAAMKNTRSGTLFSKGPRATQIHYKRTNHLSDYSKDLGLFIFKKDTGANLVSNASQFAGYDIDLNVARVLIAIMEGKKPSKIHFNNIIALGSENARRLLEDGKDAFVKTLEERKTLNPELSAKCDESIQNLDKLNSILKRKVNGYNRAIQKTEDEFEEIFNKLYERKSKMEQLRSTAQELIEK